MVVVEGLGEPERLLPIIEYAKVIQKVTRKERQGVILRDRGTSMNRWLVGELVSESEMELKI